MKSVNSDWQKCYENLKKYYPAPFFCRKPCMWTLPEVYLHCVFHSIRFKVYKVGIRRYPFFCALSAGARDVGPDNVHRSGGDFNIICFRAKNVLSLQYGSAGAASDRPFFVPAGPFSGETGPIMGFRTWLVGGITWLVVFPGPACSVSYMACTRREKCRKVKNVNVGNARGYEIFLFFRLEGRKCASFLLRTR